MLIALSLILAVIMFSLGLGLRGDDFTRVLKFPRAFAAGLFNQLVLLPLVAFGLVKLFDFPPVLALGTMILALCPGGVTSNVLTRMAKGHTALSISMTAVTSLLSIVTIPFLIVWLSQHFLGEASPEINIAKTGLMLFLLTVVPVLLGMLVTRIAPGWVEKFSPLVSILSLVLFAVIVVGALAANWEVVSANFAKLGPGLVVLNVLLLLIGLTTAKLLRLGQADASTIALESGVQNGALGITVGSLVAGSPVGSLPPESVPSAVYGLTMYALAIPFVLCRRKGAAKLEATR